MSSRYLAELTGEPDKVVAKVVDKLEQLSGFASEDVRLLAAHRRRVAAQIDALGLDSSDTTAEELYHRLQVKFQEDVRHLARAVNYEADDQNQRAEKIIQLARAVQPDVNVLSLKKTAAKRLLRANPPKHLMKLLNYRSLESLLKREDPARLLAAAPAVEGSLWNRKFIKDLAKLRAVDFEDRPIDYLAMTDKRWGKSFNQVNPVNYVPLAGAVVVWPAETLRAPESVGFTVLALQAAEILEVDSIYLRTYRFSPELGKLAAGLFADGEQAGLDVAGQTYFDWHNFKHLFSPKLDALESFTKLHPAFSWWRGSGHAAVLGSAPVSMHLADTVGSFLRGADFDRRRLASGLSGLKSDLLKNYLRHDNVRNYFLGKFDSTAVALEPAAEDSISADLEAGLI